LQERNLAIERQIWSAPRFERLRAHGRTADRRLLRLLHGRTGHRAKASSPSRRALWHPAMSSKQTSHAKLRGSIRNPWAVVQFWRAARRKKTPRTRSRGDQGVSVCPIATISERRPALSDAAPAVCEHVKIMLDLLRKRKVRPRSDSAAHVDAIMRMKPGSPTPRMDRTPAATPTTPITR